MMKEKSKDVKDFIKNNDLGYKHFKGWIDKDSVTTMGWVWAIEEMDTENNELVVFCIPKSEGVDLKLVKEIELFIREKLGNKKPE